MSRRSAYYEDNEYDDFDEDVQRGSKRPSPHKEKQYNRKTQDRKHWEDPDVGYDQDDYR